MKKQFLLLITFTLFGLSNFAQNNTQTLKQKIWSPKSKLTLIDMQPVDTNSWLSLYTESLISLICEYSIEDQKLKYDVHCIFTPKSINRHGSSKKKSTDFISDSAFIAITNLRFNLYELYARRIRQYFQSSEGTSFEITFNKDIKSTLYAFKKGLQCIDVDMGKATNYGIDKTNVKIWDEYIRSSLTNLQKYSTATGTVNFK